MPGPSNSRAGARLSLVRAVLVLAAAGALAGCPGGAASDETGAPGDTGQDDGTDASDGTGDGGDSTILVGSFQLQLTEPKPASGDVPATPGATTLFGKLYDGPTPQTLVWEPGTEAGACRLLTPRVPFCSTPCGGSAACVEDETCQDYPTAVSAGPVLVTGVATSGGETSFTMEPIADNYQPPVGTTLAYPAFAEGDAITLAAAGEMLAAFELAATGVGQLELDADEITLDPAADVELGWTPPGAGTEPTIAVKLDISHHGGTKGMIECEADDTGSLTIQAALVAELLDLGVAGYPTIVVTRASTGSTTTAAGRVDLVVSSQVERAVLVDGLVSCTDDASCPDGQTCQPDLKCQ
jgi:hypothetical protein